VGKVASSREYQDINVTLKEMLSIHPRPHPKLGVEYILTVLFTYSLDLSYSALRAISKAEVVV